MTKTKKASAKNLRDALIHTAITLIAKDGIEEFTFEKLARAQKVQRAHVAYYFKDRTELLEAVLVVVLTRGAQFIEDQVSEKMIAHPKDRPRFWEHALTAYCDAQESWVRKHPSDVSCLLLVYHLSSANPIFRKILHRARETGHMRLLQILSKHPKLGNLPLRKLNILCQSLHEMVTGHLLYLTAFLNEPKLDAETSLIQQLKVLIPE